MLIIQMRITKDIHRVLQGVIIVEELQTAGYGEHNLCALTHVQRMDGTGVFDDVVAWFGDPVVSIKTTVNKYLKVGS